MAIETNQSRVALKPTDYPVILHISDLHFGYDENLQTKDDRKKALDCLADRITNLDKSWHPKYICITGDIGYRGGSDDYELAAEWLGAFLTKLSLPFVSVFMCPGNHDVNRSIAEKHGRPSRSEEADKMLSLPVSSHFSDIFSNYIAFQKNTEIPEYEVGSDEGAGCYLYGVRRPGDGIRFICCNSCWYSKNDEDRRKLWIGAPLLRSLDSRGLISKRSDSQTIDIALIHHPKEWLADLEYMTQGRHRVAAFDYLARMTQIVLTGHTHADLRKWDQNEHEAYVCGGGASWASISHPNTFRLIRIDREKQVFEYKSFQWDASQLKWQEVLLDESNLRFFQNKVEEYLTVACRAQSTPFGAMASIQQMEPATGKEELLYETQIDRNTNIANVPEGPSVLVDKSIEANLIVKEMIDKMRSQSKRGDYTKAFACWETNSDWFRKNSAQVDVTLANELGLLVEEIKLYRKQA